MNTKSLSNNMLNFREKIYSYVAEEKKMYIKTLEKTDKIYTEKQLEETTQKLNDLLDDEALHAEYSVHEDFGRIMIKIIEDKTDKVILEIPPEKILDMLAGICKNTGLFDKKV